MTDRLPTLELERLTLAFSNLNTEGKTPVMRVLGRTTGIQPAHVVECRRVAPLSPPPPATNGPKAVSLGLFRGETIDYIIAKAANGPDNLQVVQYLLAPAQTLRMMGGNLRIFAAFAAEPIGPGQNAPYSLIGQSAPSAEVQIDDLQAILDFCNGSVRIVGGLLAALVQGWGLSVLNAPPGLIDRLRFVQGLLTLLPPPARVAITFATLVQDGQQTNTQIKFLAQPETLERHVRYDWQSSELLDPTPEDTYTRFIISQLRLDPSVVVEKTAQLARIAVWRAMRRENMAVALGWSSRRLTIDDLVISGQPVDSALVAGVLREDPTLPDDMRTRYVRHLLALALANGDVSNTEVIPPLAAQNPDIGRAVLEQLQTASAGEQADNVYRLVEHWIAQGGPEAARWRPVLASAAAARVNALLGGPGEQLLEFLQGFLDAQSDRYDSQMIAQILAPTRRAASQDPAVARMVALIGAAHLPIGMWQRVVADPGLLSRLPASVRNTIPFLQPNGPRNPPPGLLPHTAASFESAYEALVLARFAEWAFFARRLDLFDIETLRGLVRAALSPYGDRLDALAEPLVIDLSIIDRLREMPDQARRSLIALCLARGRNDLAVGQIALYAAKLYPVNQSDALADLVGTTFVETPLSVEAVISALQAIHAAQLPAIIRARAHLGALERHDWAVSLLPIARQLCMLIASEPRLIAAVGVNPAMRLLRLMAEQREVQDSVRLAGALVNYTLTFNEHRPDLLDMIYGLLNWNPDVSAIALQLLRDYLRRAATEHATQLPRQLGEKYGENVRRVLDSTYRLRQMLGEGDFGDMALEVQAGLLLMDMAVYYEGREIPPIFKLRRSLESMPGGLTDIERRRLADNLALMVEQIMKLYQRHQNRNGRRSKAEMEVRKAGLYSAKIPPATGIEALTWLSAHFGEGRIYALRLDREAPALFLSPRSVNMLLQETDRTVRLLSGLLDAFPESGGLDLEIMAFVTEVEGRWGNVTLFRQREIQKPFAENMNLLAQTLQYVGEKANERNLRMDGPGRQLYIGKAQPRSVLEALRWMSGYFAGQHTNG